mmetsp:Transcript_8162/g.17037  ORF Transcript_8162/g.17037 Transcript_8162/m.17037 type:complete len:185 (-) Transcript_8162:14-568(-)
MVQGNSDRRKELAVGRRNDRKAEKARKKAGVVKATPSEARSRLLEISRSLDLPLTAWVESSEPGREVCAQYFRTGDCGSKRCKYSHEACLSAAPPSAPPNSRQSLPALSCMDLVDVDPGGQLVYDKNLRTQRRAKSRLLFVELEGELVFDFEDPNLFREFVSRISTPPGEAEVIEAAAATTADR